MCKKKYTRRTKKNRKYSNLKTFIYVLAGIMRKAEFEKFLFFITFNFRETYLCFFLQNISSAHYSVYPVGNFDLPIFYLPALINMVNPIFVLVIYLPT